MSLDSRSILTKVFGHTDFRLSQEAVIRHVMNGGNALVLMPTGGGKSLCYQIPALTLSGVCIVISPLIALMKDQVEALKVAGVSAEFLNSSVDPEEQRIIESRLINGEIKLLYIAPERATQPPTMALFERLNISLFAIDEAHCVSRWGHDFRPSYLELAQLKRFTGIPRIALTATADDHTRKDILERLELDTAKTFISGFDRPNIRYHISLKSEPKQQLLSFLQGRGQECGIIYCLSRKKTEETADWLKREGYNAFPYHAGLPQEVRSSNQNRFLKDEAVIMVATVAFGMGIDRPDVRFVFHMDLPDSIEAYYQETGRCGRDGMPAEAHMLYGLQDVVMRRQMLESTNADESHKRVEFHKLNALLNLCETVTCRRQLLLNYFGDHAEAECGNCDSCLSPSETWDGTIPAQKALSCVYRTEQRFGVGYLIDVLTGKSNERMIRFGHDRLRTFGIGSELTVFEWKSVYRQLIALGYLTVDVEHGSLKLTASSRKILFENEMLTLRKESKTVRQKKSPVKTRRKTDSPVQTALSESDQPLWNRLRQTRTDLAEKNGVPPYVIFHDTTLLAMVQSKPKDESEFASLPGVGEAKLRKYAEIFLEILNS